MTRQVEKTKFFYENLFYQFCTTDRLSKLLAQFKIFEQVCKIPGDIIEFGVFKGNSLIRLIIFREILSRTKNIYALDKFGEFKIPRLILDSDKKKLKLFLKDAGKKSISLKFLKKNLISRGLYRNVNLIKGDIFKTLNNFLLRNKKKKFSFVNLDVDLYHVTYFILKKIWPKVNKGGIILFDEYNEETLMKFPGSKKAVDEYLLSKDINPSEMIKKDLSGKCFYIKN